MRQIIIGVISILLVASSDIIACSVVYYVDPGSGKIYVANNEDYWYDVNAYIQIMPSSKNKLARLWYGWNNFAQGGVNEAGLFFDGAVTPNQPRLEGYTQPKGNLGDDILANCKTVEEAIKYLEKKKIALHDAHLMFGDSTGKAVIVEWINGKKELISIQENHLTMTNFLVADNSNSEMSCTRYKSIEDRITALMKNGSEVSLLQVGNTIAGAAQAPRKDGNNRVGGTLYSTFIDISEMKFVLVYKLDNSDVVKLDLSKEFDSRKKRKISLD